MPRTLRRCLLVPLVAVLSLSDQTRTSPPSRLPPTLQQATQRAGTIFAGTVTSITPIRATSPDQVESVQVTFQVEQAIRGVRVGQTLSLREWTGLWSSGERYHLGERLMLFLYAPSKIGLTSPAGGPAGRFTVDKEGRVQLSRLQAQAVRVMVPQIRIDPDHRVPMRDFTRALRRMAVE
jgi:hypothetical protein